MGIPPLRTVAKLNKIREPLVCLFYGLPGIDETDQRETDDKKAKQPDVTDNAEGLQNPTVSKESIRNSCDLIKKSALNLDIVAHSFSKRPHLGCL